jgi:hypothetical protein
MSPKQAYLYEVLVWTDLPSAFWNDNLSSHVTVSLPTGPQERTLQIAAHGFSEACDLALRVEGPKRVWGPLWVVEEVLSVKRGPRLDAHTKSCGCVRL